MLRAQTKVSFHTFGCKLNYAETEELARKATQARFTVVKDALDAQVHVINTCSVTENADKKCMKLIRAIKQANSDVYIVVVGCYAQLQAQEIAKMEGVSLVLGSQEKFKLLDYLGALPGLMDPTSIHCADILAPPTFHPAVATETRTRSFLKIQDGCSYSCSFCTIPLARGKSVSGEPTQIITDILNLERAGVKEIVLTGVNIGDYKYVSGSKKLSFLGLLEMICKLDSKLRIRISSIEVNLLSEAMIDLIAASPIIASHFHIPLQAGADKVLRLMKRRYNTALYAERVAYIRKKMPRSCIGADVIVGFPGETHQDFNDTYNFIDKLDLAYLHVFPYSDRHNTISINMPGKLSAQEKKMRSGVLSQLSAAKRKKFYARQLTSHAPVLFETPQHDTYITGLTDNYIRVYAPYDPALANQVKTARLVELDEHSRVFVELV